jgi:membrane associated rhomboid family serine protease
MNSPTSLLIILATCVVSWFGFRDRAFEERLIFNPEAILGGKEYHRLVTSGFLHAGWNHLVGNMLSLYFFAPWIEWRLGRDRFLLVYFGAIIGGSLLSLYVHRHHHYRAYGASGGVCGIIFAYVLLIPRTGVNLYFAIPVPGWLYAIGFIVWSFYALKSGRDNVGHDAHLGGAIVGLLLAAGLAPASVRENWVVFLLVLVPAILLLVYLWMNPLLLPLTSFLRGGVTRRSSQPSLPWHRREAKQLDAILEKVGREGIHSLTPAEQDFLRQVSGKYQRRSESKKPESDLII